VFVDKIVDRPVYIDKIVEKERIVNVPQVQEVVVEKVVDRPVYVDKIVDRIVDRPVDRIVEKAVSVPQTVYVDKYIDRPQIIERVIEHEKVVHVPQVQQIFVEKNVETPVYVDRVVDRVVEQPINRIVETRVEIPKIQTIEKIVDRPVYVDRVVDRVVEKPIHHVPITYSGAPQGLSSASTQLPSSGPTPPGTPWGGSSMAVLPPPAPATQPLQWNQTPYWEPPPMTTPPLSSRRAVGDIGAAWGSFGPSRLPPSDETVWSMPPRSNETVYNSPPSTWAPPPPAQPPRSARGMTTTVPLVGMVPAMPPDDDVFLQPGDDFPYHDPFEGCNFEGRDVEWSSGNFLR